MSDESRPNRSCRIGWWLVFFLMLVVISVGDLASMFHSQLNGERNGSVSERENAVAAQTQLKAEIEDLKNAATEREAEFATRSEELRQREAAIAGREDAATERTQSSFQGLLIQQQLTKNLEALKASLPDLTPEVEKLAKEHAQLGAERQRLEKEIADLRRRLGQPDSAVGQ